MNPLSVRVEVVTDCRSWLIANGYSDVEARISELLREWKLAGLGTRRDWWLVLAGTAEGKPRKVYGYTFPVLKAARRRQGFPPDVEGAVERSPHELAPSIERQERWGKGFKRVLK